MIVDSEPPGGPHCMPQLMHGCNMGAIGISLCIGIPHEVHCRSAISGHVHRGRSCTVCGGCAGDHGCTGAGYITCCDAIGACAWGGFDAFALLCGGFLLDLGACVS